MQLELAEAVEDLETARAALAYSEAKVSRREDAVRAVVVLAAGEQLTFEELHAHAAASLARYKVPTSVNFLPSLPHSLTGKVSRARLRELGLTGNDVPVEVGEARDG